MPAPKVNIAIPTYNRADLLARSLASVLQQDYPDFEVTILDNASTDHTGKLVASVRDSRVRYIRNPTNVGLLRNWNRTIETNSSMYLCLLQDDDILLPGFIRESAAALDQYPHAGFSTVRARVVDIDGVPLTNHELEQLPAGILGGLDYLHAKVAGGDWYIPSSSMTMRSEMLRQTGPFDNAHSRFTVEVNLCYRLAACSDIVVIPQLLCEVRHHAASETQTNVDLKTFPLADLAERTEAIAHLLQSPRAADASYRVWLAERLRDLNLRRSHETVHLIPSLNYGWSEQLETAQQDLRLLIPSGDRFILVDESQWGWELAAEGHGAIPFLERDGQYWGPPADDAAAILEVERQREGGAKFIAFGWQAFWWLDYYGGLRDHLTSRYRRVARNSRFVVFDLTGPPR